VGEEDERVTARCGPGATDRLLAQLGQARRDLEVIERRRVEILAAVALVGRVPDLYRKRTSQAGVIAHFQRLHSNGRSSPLRRQLRHFGVLLVGQGTRSSLVAVDWAVLAFVGQVFVRG
jgi:hypothetical protein